MERQKLQTLNNSGIADNTSLKDSRECEKLRDRWGSDPMHDPPVTGREFCPG